MDQNHANFGTQSNQRSQKRVTVENKKLFENDKIVNNPNEVSNHSKKNFSTVVDKIGIDVVYDSSNQPSIKEILNNREQVPDFEFNKVTNENVDKILNKINIKKATGADGIPAKIVKKL